ncbi:MAG: HlyC/CorC family transporter [Okeania sp. SIO2G4]|uniref:hemolysin family protein n=1 Tax=unclassified Okeania TaxID=2634635 RepID=UPI0013B85E66|nr:MULTISPECIES: hemolysin family protein [unclassified Okeania]NEP06589.1 HlyC/CorC family transporter [Okeania sp. SIO4D6]NEP73652.1 HlyC/CorC family transporter [Okeania sp. SIO2G5]NEP94398.1 HlyC/CorC family transporter [Okeania sp. SIO2F5]NEQ92212.1 HlyC/CorC family transporter [Okeania sp. SIO2G4]
MLKLTIIVLIILIGSALCSATETALLSVSPIKVQQLAQSKKPAALALWGIRKKINRPIATVVIINNIFNIVGSILIGNIAASVLGNAWLGVFSAILTFLVIVFGEIIPKTLGERYAMQFALTVAIPVQGLTFIFTPIVWLMEKITSPFTKGQKLPTTNEAEIMFLTRVGYKEGVIEGDEAEMIRRVFRLNDKNSFDIMTPRIATTYLYANATLAEVKSDIIASQHSRIIVIGDSIDDVLGVALKNELLKGIIEGKDSNKIYDFMRDVRFIPDTLRVDLLLKEFQKNRQHLMVVLDEYGGMSGVVTLEDVLEELTGEIVDETDQSVDLQILARMRGKRKLKDE